MNTQLQHKETTPKTWLTYTIRLIFLVWKERCNTNHGNTNQDKRQRALIRLTPRINSIYKKQNLIEQSEQHIFERSIEETLQLPTYTIEKWLYITEPQVQASIKRKINQERQTIRPIHNYFQRIIQPIRIHPQRNPQEAAIAPRINNPTIIARITQFFQPNPTPYTAPQIDIPHTNFRPP